MSITVAASDQKIRAPLWVISLTEEVIRARKKCARWFSQQAGDAKNSACEESNLSHQHFISVLESVLEVLVQLQEPGTKSITRDENLDGSDPLEAVTNIFEALELEPDTEHTLAEPSPCVSEVKSPKHSAVLEEEHTEEETFWLNTYSTPFLHLFHTSFLSV